MSNNHQALRATGLHKQYGNRWVVSDVDIEVNKGEIIGLLGPNGASKTTTFFMITGMIKPTKGQIFLDDEEITGKAMYMRARSGIGYLAQEPSIFGKLTVENNLRLVLEMTTLSKEDQNDKIEKLLEDMSIQHIRKNKGHDLSGGERRRVEICRALAMDPDFILLDEPFAGIDPISLGDIRRIITHLRDIGIGVLITDHNVRETLGICDRAYILAQGRIVTSGTADHILAHPEVRAIYLGDEFSL